MSENIAAALVGALTDLTNIAKGHEGGGGGKKYTYANIADLVAETRPVLAAHGLVALTPVHHQGDDLACSVVLLHESGERLDFGPATFPHGNDAQATGSWITYMRRYCLLAALGMATEDDDGASARPAQPPRQQQRQTPPLSDSQRHEIEAAIGALDEAQTERLKAEWKQRKIRRLETLTTDDVDAVHALIVEIEAGVPA